MKFCLRGADLGWMAHLANLHMKRVQQRGKKAAKTLKWGMETAAESQKVHTFWSRFRFVRGAFSCLPRRNVRARCCTPKISWVLWWHPAQSKPALQDKCMFNLRQGQITDTCSVWKRAAASGRCRCYLLSLDWWNDTKPNTMALLHATAASSSAPPCRCLPSRRSWNCIVMVCVGRGERGKWAEKEADWNGNICLFGGVAYCKSRRGFIAPRSRRSAPENVALHSEPQRQEIISAWCGPAKRPLLLSQTYKTFRAKASPNRPSALFLPTLQRSFLRLNTLNRICVSGSRGKGLIHIVALDNEWLYNNWGELTPVRCCFHTLQTRF